MAAIAGDDDPARAATMLLTPLAGQFDCRFTGLAAAIEQAGLITPGTFAKTLSKLEHASVMQTETGIDQTSGLVRNSLEEHRWAVTEAVGTTALGEVQIGVVLAVPQPRALPSYENLLRPFHARHQVVTAKVFARPGVIHDRVIKAGRMATRFEQIHPKNPPLRFFVLPM